MDQLMHRPEVERMTGMATSTLYAAMARDEFPWPIRIGKQAVAWPASRVQEWIDEQIARDRRVADIRGFRRTGWSRRRIAAQLDISLPTVSRIMRERGIE